jgi:hypothetical protein
MANTTNFGWATPDDTDLVKDGAAAIRTLGSSIDNSFVDLKGGTTGQVLAKASNTDLDFTWATDASGIPATIFDAKGDLIAASAADTAARLAVGANGTVLMADSGETTGLKWGTVSAGWTLLSTTNLTTTLTDITSISQSYTNLMIEIEGISIPTGQRLNVQLRNSTNAQTVYASGVKEGGNVATYNGLSSIDIFDANITATDTRNVVIIAINNYAASTRHGLQIYGTANNGGIYRNMAGGIDNTIAINAVRVNTGSVPTAGTVKIWGI